LGSCCQVDEDPYLRDDMVYPLVGCIREGSGTYDLNVF
jgi:hypothetical protein